jgi:hypothetical protein
MFDNPIVLVSGEHRLVFKFPADISTKMFPQRFGVLEIRSWDGVSTVEGPAAGL